MWEPSSVSICRISKVMCRSWQYRWLKTFLVVMRKILLVDDQQLVLDTGRMMLEKAGYSVATADNGLSALDVYNTYAGNFDLVILDLSMPRMSGRETLVGLMRNNPKVKVIISSGFDQNETISSLIAKGARGFVPKPYRIYQLLQAVRKVLDEE